MKKLPAIIAALVTTGVMAVAIVLIGFNALVNPNVAQAANSPDPVVETSAGSEANTAQLQERIAQYQAREQQYQSQLTELEQRLQQSSDEVQQYQQLVGQLQQMGVIRIDEDGNVSVRRSRRDD